MDLFFDQLADLFTNLIFMFKTISENSFTSPLQVFPYLACLFYSERILSRLFIVKYIKENCCYGWFHIAICETSAGSWCNENV